MSEQPKTEKSYEKILLIGLSLYLFCRLVLGVADIILQGKEFSLDLDTFGSSFSNLSLFLICVYAALRKKNKQTDRKPMDKEKNKTNEHGNTFDAMP